MLQYPNFALKLMWMSEAKSKVKIENVVLKHLFHILVFFYF